MVTKEMIPMIEWQVFDGIIPETDVAPECLHKVYVNLGEVLDYADAPEELYNFKYKGDVTMVNYMNGFCRFLIIYYVDFHAIMMKYKESRTRYIIQTKFN